MDTKEIEVTKNYWPISHGLFFRRRSIGPLPYCKETKTSLASKTKRQEVYVERGDTIWCLIGIKYFTICFIDLPSLQLGDKTVAFSWFVSLWSANNKNTKCTHFFFLLQWSVEFLRVHRHWCNCTNITVLCGRPRAMGDFYRFREITVRQ